MLYKTIEEIFPQLFGYQAVGVLFMDLVQGNLYGIRTKNLTGGAMELK